MFRENLPLIVVTVVIIVALGILYNKVSSLEQAVVDICMQQDSAPPVFNYQPKSKKQKPEQMTPTTTIDTADDKPITLTPISFEDLTETEITLDPSSSVPSSLPKPILKKKGTVKTMPST